MTRSRRSTSGRQVLAAALVALATMGTAACSSGGGGDSDAMSAQVQDAPAPAASRAEAEAAGGTGSTSSFAADGFAIGAGPAEADTAGALERKEIATGTVVLRADDVGEARQEVLAVVDRFGGEVAEEESATDDDGALRRSRMVLRVPTRAFDDAVEGLSGAAELVTAQTGSEDVTTKVLDVAIRVRVQRRSIRRIELLLDRAQSIRDIMAIEAQLTRRQAELASLEKQQDYLADQTSMATITVTLQRTVEAQTQEKKEESGFLAGLAAGWHGLVTLAVTGATVAGAVLPFAVVALLVAIPAYPLLRRLRRRTAAG